MSPLTKLFVVLNAIFSIVLASAVAILVTKTEPLQEQVATANGRADRAEGAYSTERSRVDTITAERNDAVNQLNESRNAISTEKEALNSKIKERDTELATLKSQLAIEQIERSKLATGLKIASDSGSKKDEEIKALRDQVFASNTRVAELNQRVSDLEAQNDVLARELKLARENTASINTDRNRLVGLLKDRGIDPGLEGGRTAGAPRINGVISEVLPMQNGILMATITVGKNDDVRSGMVFNVVDEVGFVGQLTVISVDERQATGRVESSVAARVRAGAKVATQLASR